jgi:serine/threonine protein kinase
VPPRYTTGMRTRRIAGRYELLEQLGGSSWRAADRELGRDVLIRFAAREAGVARLTHPSIVPLFDQGEDGGERYTVFEYLPGGSLAQRLEGGPLSEAEAERIGADVSHAVAYAHDQGITHGSLGPEAVLLDSEGRAKVAGFAGQVARDEDERALAALLATLNAATAAEGDADVTAVLPTAVRPPARRRPLALIALAALVLAVAGVGAALLATSGESTPDGGATGSVSLPDSAATTREEPEPVAPPPATTAEETTTQATTAPPAPTVAHSTEAQPTTAPPATTEPPPTEPPPPTTEPPPATSEPPPTTEPPPPTATAGTTATTG